MKITEQQLATIGCGGTLGEPVCWAVSRITAPRGEVRRQRVRFGPDPEHSRGLAYWRRLLARQELPPGYRISPA